MVVSLGGRRPMAVLCLVALLLVTVTEAVGDDCVENLADMRMLQLGTTVSGKETNVKKEGKHVSNCGHLTQDMCDSTADALCSNNCKIHTHGKDCYRPIPEVMAEHPEEDGYCYFNWTGFWVNPLPDTNPDFEASSVSGILGLRGPDYHGKDQGPLITFHFDGKVITTNLDSAHYSYDDLYGYSLGYLQGQGLDSTLMKNSSQWMEISKEKCLKLQEEFNFQNESWLSLAGRSMKPRPSSDSSDSMGDDLQVWSCLIIWLCSTICILYSLWNSYSTIFKHPLSCFWVRECKRIFLYLFLFNYQWNPNLLAATLLWPTTFYDVAAALVDIASAEEELVLADWLDDNAVIATKVLCAANLSAEAQPLPVRIQANYKSAEDCEPVTRREFAKHHYVKCLLGYANSASDGAYLNARACLLEGNHIGHFTDCPYSPNVSFWHL